MTCKACRLALDAYVDGELSCPEQRSVRQHLADCPSCAVELVEVQDLKRALGRLNDCPIPAGLEDRLVRNVLGEPAPQATRPALRVGWAVAGLAAAVAFAVLAVGRVQQPGTVATDSAALEEVAFEMERDQAYSAGSDPLSGRSGVLSVSYGHR